LVLSAFFGKYSPLPSTILTTYLVANRGGPGPRGALATLSQYMLSSGMFRTIHRRAFPDNVSIAATFGFFMSIGSVRRVPTDFVLALTFLPPFPGHPNRFSLRAPNGLFANISGSRNLRIRLLLSSSTKVPHNRKGGSQGYAAQRRSREMALGGVL
jgi:hypothetical protein